MPTTNFSIAPPSFIQFNFDGWTTEDKHTLETRARAVPGVTRVNQAGAHSSIHVHFDPKAVTREAVIEAMSSIADEIVPGHNFSGR